MTLVVAEELDFEVRGHRIHAQRFGSASAALVVGLHGTSLNMKCFDFLGERLGGEVIQLVALDLRGRGRSETTPPGTYGWANHALDAFAIADALGFERLSMVGLSMGGSVAMKAAALDGRRLDALVLVDIAGHVDRGAGEIAGALISRIGDVHASADALVDAVRAEGLVEPWTEHWERCHRYELEEVDGGVRSRVALHAVAEDRAYAATQDVYGRWSYLTMPTLLLRATRELRSGAGHVVPEAVRDLFLRDVPSGEVVEVDANHLTITSHPDTATAIQRFLTAVLARA